MSRILSLVLGLLSFSSLAQADAVIQSFNWRADSHFDLSISNDGAPVTLKGNLRDNEKAEVKVGSVTANLRSYIEGFVTIAITTDSKDVGSVFILERQNSQFVKINDAKITGKKATLVGDLDGVVTGLKKTNGWDPSIALRKVAEYFVENPKKQVSDFYDEVELGNVKTVARPKPIGNNPGNGPTVQTPKVPSSTKPISVTRPNIPGAKAPMLDDDQVPAPRTPPGPGDAGPSVDPAPQVDTGPSPEELALQSQRARAERRRQQQRLQQQQLQRQQQFDQQHGYPPVPPAPVPRGVQRWQQDEYGRWRQQNVAPPPPPPVQRYYPRGGDPYQQYFQQQQQQRPSGGLFNRLFGG